MVAILSAVCMFVFRLVDIQIVQAPELNATSLDKRSVPLVTYGIRGDIVDEDGTVMATTDVRYDVQMSPKNVRTINRLEPGGVQTVKVTPAQQFAEIGSITGQKADEIEKIVSDALAENPKSDFAYVKRSVDLKTLKALKELGIPWLTFSQNASRIYPNGAVGGNLVGFVGTDNAPLAGVELSQNACLAETNGKETYERGADGVAIPGSTVKVEERVDGGTLQLTINKDLQWQTQQIVQRQKEATGAQWAVATVADTATGQLRAVGESNTVDPNNIKASAAEDLTSKAFLYGYEPGSTYKAITAAALIDTGTATPLTQVLVPGSYVAPNGAKFRDSWSHGDTRYTLTGILVDSSNVGISLLGHGLSDETRYDYLQKFGIGTPTNAGLASESSGILHPYQEWDPQTSYTTMFGQGVSSTIVQTTGAYLTFANGGKRMPLSIIDNCTYPDGTVTPYDAGDPVQVISPESAKTMTSMLEMLPQDSWLTDVIAIPGYRIAGKTGTAQQPDGQGGYMSTYIYSFAGYFPADNPKYVVVFSIAHPATADGARQAVIGFRDVAQATIKAYAVPPSTTPAETLPKHY
ncbi:penicillin-binding protein 2 [Klugiella xanthotipulae]|uniref:Cell division protein FtsI (Penicillin-binding protein 3) n=2 Tax=Klugiella xanthotipulae TaxID=244735 RepID=A0A543HT91_9MICO|nr:cell division protein FtsI (penicillin-binding protein 3) [Klugiella xanthotipulae]